MSAHWPLHSSFILIPVYSPHVTMVEHRFKGDHIKEMLMTATCSFAWVWNVRPWGEAHFCQSVCVGGRTCFILEVPLYFWFSMQSSEFRLFTFDFHFKDFFITGMVIKLITLSDLDLYGCVLITTLIRWLRWCFMIFDWINHTYKDSLRNFNCFNDLWTSSWATWKKQVPALQWPQQFLYYHFTLPYIIFAVIFRLPFSGPAHAMMIQ